MPSYGIVPTPDVTESSPQDAWLRLAKDAHSKSTNYIENNYRKQWEDALRMFQSKHPQDSKYNSDLYKYRSKLFRPKTRSMVRKHEATASIAYFSSPEIVSVDPTIEDDQMQVASSVLMKKLLDYRLDKSIPWYILVMGGLQDALTVGVVASLQHWRYSARKTTKMVQAELPLFGPIEIEMDMDEVLEDQPCIELIPIENIRFDPAAHWYDVAGTSPYIIIQMPMYLRDVLDRMEDTGPNKWHRRDQKTILEARVASDDQMVTGRDGDKEDPQQQSGEINEFDVVMVHLNMIKADGEDWAYYTLKDKYMLTDPVPVREMFQHCDQYGDRPVVLGFAVVETHKAVPASPVHLGRDLQIEANEIVNQRLDNVKLVLNKRFAVRRGSNIDLEAVVRNVPGGAFMANDVDKDIREFTFNDVTSSAYQEQDRVNVDYDELLGSFAQSSVMTNRRMNETVGGMRMLAQGANVITEYTLRVFSETWMEPVLRQLIKMEQYYETDDVVLGLAAQQAQLFQRFGVDQVTDNLLRQQLTLSVNVGMGATDPDTRFQRFLQAMGAYSKLGKEGSPDLNLPEVRKELFGLAGFRDAARFFTQVDPRMVQAQQMLQQAETMAKQIVDQAKMQLFEKSRDLDNREHDLDIREAELGQEFSTKLSEMFFNFQLKEREAVQDLQLELVKSRAQLGLQREQANVQMSLKQAQAAHDARLREFEAQVQAAIDLFLAKVDAQIKEQMAKPKERSAKKQADGSWTITDK